MIAQAIAAVWLGHGVKYRLSEWIAGAVWRLDFSAVLAKHGLRLNGLTRLEDVIYAFRGRFAWDWDPLHGGGDYVKPPIRTLADKAGDCDDAAFLHAQAIEHALGAHGWRGRIVSYLASPWVMSHHFAVAIDPDGGFWPVQPPPAKWQPQDAEYVWKYACKDAAHAAREVADTYGVRVVAFDVRDEKWRKVQPWTTMEQK